MTREELAELIRLIEETVEPCDTVADVEAALISRGLKVQDWVSSSKRMPLMADTNGTGRVLAISRTGHVQVWHWEMVALAYNKFFCWMPLPVRS